MSSIDGNKEIMDSLLGLEVEVRLKSPSGKEVVLPKDILTYKESNGKDDGFYLAEQGYRFRPSQFSSVTVYNEGRTVHNILTFYLGKKSLSDELNRQNSLDN